VHQQAYDWVAAQIEPALAHLARSRAASGGVNGPGGAGGSDLPSLAVLEIGSLDINGSVRPLFPRAGHYHGLDLVAGDGVDEVADASTWVPPRRYDVVVSAEVLEHAPAWRAILEMMWSATAPGGTLLMTCATDPRAPHSAVDGWDVRPGEHYANVSCADVRALVRGWGVEDWSVEWAQDRGDLYLQVRRPSDGPSDRPGA
jgi:hypothetical protein